MNNGKLSKDDLQLRQKDPASQAALIETSRAIAQVQGALTVAQGRPRDEISARIRMQQACQHRVLADQAFYRFPRAGEQITGPSIHLATELARCWGNIDYGVSELNRDDQRGISEMLTYAWDMQNNAKSNTSFIVPHRRETKKGIFDLVGMRDIYENNSNAGARRLRECILRVLPASFIEEAKEICMETLREGDGTPIEERREKLLKAFADRGVTRKQIEKKIGRAADQLSAYDIGNLRVIFGSLQRGEATATSEFDQDIGNAISDELRGGAGDGKQGEDSRKLPDRGPGETAKGYPSADQADADPESSPGDWRQIARDAHARMAEATVTGDLVEIHHNGQMALVGADAPETALEELVSQFNAHYASLDAGRQEENPDPSDKKAKTK